MSGAPLRSTTSLVMTTMVDRIGELLLEKGMDGHDVVVSYAQSVNNRSYDDVYLADVQDWFSEVATMKAGRKSRNEEYRVVINIFCVRDNAQEATDAAIEHAATIEEWFAEEPSLGLNVEGLATLRVQETEMSVNVTYDDAQVWRSHVMMRPTVRSRLA